MLKRPSAGGTISVEEYRALEPESAFQARVIEYAELHGWHAVHVTPARWVAGKGLVPDATQRGFPDLLFIREVTPARPVGLIFCELKTKTGRERAGQPEWRASLLRAGVPCYLWRPSMWDEIERVLA